MKFGQLFKSALQNEGYPPDWIESAISYSQLKKCINRLSSELSDLGLDPVTLGKLLKHVEDYNASAAHQSDDADRPFEYILDDSDDEDHPNRDKKKHTFQPKLIFNVDEATGALHSAQLDEKTKRKLQMLAVETGMTDLRIFEEETDPKDTDPKDTGEQRRTRSPDHQPHHGDGPSPTPSPASSPRPSLPPTRTSSRTRPGYRKIEIPLSSDIEFFTKLTTALSGLESLRQREQIRMDAEIQRLNQQITHLTDPDRRANKKLLSVWRQIFQMYLEQGVFFGTTERDHSAHDAEKAQERWAEFCAKLAATGLQGKLKKKEAGEALEGFMRINREILTGLRFGEINNTAMRKILKSEFPLFFLLFFPFPFSIQTHTHIYIRIHVYVYGLGIGIGIGAALTPARVRQTHRPLPPPSPSAPTPNLPHNPNLHPPHYPFHNRPVAHPPRRRLPLPHVHGHKVAARDALLPSHLLHPVPHRDAEQEAGSVSAV